MGKIKTFVQQTLGCGCPEEVFTHVNCRTNILLGKIRLSHKINIGNKLLIFIVDIGGSESLKETLTSLVYEGKKERDGKGFNRFRLVLAVDNPGMVGGDAFDIFDTLEKDERVHLHVVQKNDIAT